jgi:hypothetical protein
MPASVPPESVTLDAVDPAPFVDGVNTAAAPAAAVTPINARLFMLPPPFQDRTWIES